MTSIQKLYLDTCIISNFIANSIDESELTAIAELANSPKFEFVTSNYLKEEVFATKEERVRNRLIFTASLLKKIQYIPEVRMIPPIFGARRLGRGTFGGPVFDINLKYQELQTIFDLADAKHIFQCHSNDCNVFLTFDYSTILSKRERFYEIQRKWGTNLLLMMPSEYLKYVQPTSLY